MKAYYLVSPYLSDIQKGIQVSHCTSEMAIKAMDGESNAKQFYDWANEERTIIVLNYGTFRNIVDLIYDYLEKSNTRFYGVFKERELNNLPTIGFILSQSDVRKIGQLRQERKFTISPGLRKAYSFSYHLEKGIDEVSKRDWFECICAEVDNDPLISDTDFLRILSTFHLA